MEKCFDQINKRDNTKNVINLIIIYVKAIQCFNYSYVVYDAVL